MEKNFLIFFCLFLINSLHVEARDFLEELANVDKIVIAQKKIEFSEYPGAHNPSMIKIEEGFLFIFRYFPDPSFPPWISYIGIVILDDSFNPISKPELLNTRPPNHKIPSQSEDARIFTYRGRIFLIYNDNQDKTVYQYWDRRDMFMAELMKHEGRFSLSSPLKLVYEEEYQTRPCQKNWVPFEWNKQFLLGYKINPHKLLSPNLMNGKCYEYHETSPPIHWNYGELRGGTPPVLIDGEYFSFFHSGMITSSNSSHGANLWHYFMGAYTFESEPPFRITKMTPIPIVAKGFYTPSSYNKRVIFPGGVVVDESTIYLAYGKDDCEMWIATLDLDELKKTLVSLE